MRQRAWDEGLETGVETMDGDHRLMVSVVNALEDALGRGADRPAVEESLRRLLEFTAVHFRSEEAMMRVHGYPELGSHAEEHTRLLPQLDLIATASLSEDAGRAIDLVASLRTWLTSHIKSMDQPFASWCAGKGLHPGKP
jgi:hemerythrin-like metal-binding protein